MRLSLVEHKLVITNNQFIGASIIRMTNEVVCWPGLPSDHIAQFVTAGHAAAAAQSTIHSGSKYSALESLRYWLCGPALGWAFLGSSYRLN
jgi:hypothetical protein